MEGKTGLEPEMEMRTGKQEQGREEGEKRGSKGEIRNGGLSPDITPSLWCSVLDAWHPSIQSTLMHDWARVCARPQGQCIPMRCTSVHPRGGVVHHGGHVGYLAAPACMWTQ